MGGLPPSLLISGTPAEVKDHVKQMIELFKDGGLILANAQASLPKEVKEENLTAVIETVKEMG
jgi:uroporphyrinogen-III decarboxylase